jgi:TolA-binding protein
MLKPVCLLLCLGVFSGAICAETTDGCAGLDGTALTLCRSNQQTLQLQQQLEQQLQQQQERQNQLDKQQREVQQQLETMRLQNESLRKQLELEAANRPVTPAAKAVAASTRNADLKAWKAENRWYGTDYPRTQFATRYMKKLEKERPELGGRELLDAVAAKVNETFGTKQ